MNHSSDFREQYEKHLTEEHHAGVFSEYLKEIVYGGNDGIVTTFAVVAGFSGAEFYSHAAGVGTAAVLLFGLANLFADAASMGLGNFLSLRSEIDLYRQHRKKEEREIIHHRDFERAETIEILVNERDVDQNSAEKFADLYEKNPKFWADFMMDYELKISDPRDENPALNGLATFLSFMFFGVIPLLPYFFLAPNRDTFWISVGTTSAAIILLGVLRWVVTRENWVRCIGETIIVGGVCAVIAYAVGTFFRV